MEIDFDTNELPPLNMCQATFWETAIEQLFKDSSKILPVYLEIPVSNERVGSYFLRLIKEDSKLYLQAEGFDSKTFESGFTIGSDLWKPVQPGVYRLDISN